MPVAAPEPGRRPGSRAPVFALNLTLREEQRAAIDVLVEAATVAAVVAGEGRVAAGERAVASTLGILAQVNAALLHVEAVLLILARVRAVDPVVARFPEAPAI